MKIRDKILKFVKKSIKNRGVPPTLIEIGKRFKISHIAAMYHLNKLKLERKIRTRKVIKRRAARSIKPVLMKIRN
ncbi:MAG TPA: hypothetical protein DCX95_02250 [Elusimicrobia bacterium]|nr:hypothetical protein [Elusimicrobiota bacterium]